MELFVVDHLRIYMKKFMLHVEDAVIHIHTAS